MALVLHPMSKVGHFNLHNAWKNRMEMAVPFCLGLVHIAMIAM